jgi:hypothetical protein
LCRSSPSGWWGWAGLLPESAGPPESFGCLGVAVVDEVDGGLVDGAGDVEPGPDVPREGRAEAGHFSPAFSLSQ